MFLSNSLNLLLSNKILKYSLEPILSWWLQWTQTCKLAICSLVVIIVLHFEHLLHNPSGVSFFRVLM